GSKVEQLIQVCYDMSSEKTRKRELDALIEASEELHCDNLLVITNSQEEKIDWKGKEITILKVSDF
ncbi:MAG: ATPase, partial [Muribaculaceae bacterium]|nr:ATPase [Muribaculaceae bacterium]